MTQKPIPAGFVYEWLCKQASQRHYTAGSSIATKQLPLPNNPLITKQTDKHTNFSPAGPPTSKGHAKSQKMVVKALIALKKQSHQRTTHVHQKVLTYVPSLAGALQFASHTTRRQRQHHTHKFRLQAIDKILNRLCIHNKPSSPIKN